jgi:glycosyltransferase involved in cell wall biosynthesis
MKLRIEPSVAVIVPTIGSDKLEKAIESIDAQSYGNLAIILVADGVSVSGTERVYNLLDNGSYTKETQVIWLPYNTGADGHYGHRIYSAIPHLLNHDFIAFLDEDNWYEPNHIDTIVDTFQSNPDAQFVHSLRNICGEGTEFICQDNCESLGFHPVWWNEMEHLVDTSTYAFRKDFIQQTCNLWHSKWGGDRRFLYAVKGTPFACTGKYTLNYRLDGNPNSVKPEFFLEGNRKMDEKYQGVFPWAKL